MILVKKLVLTTGRMIFFCCIYLGSNYQSLTRRINTTSKKEREWLYEIAKNIFLCKMFWQQQEKRKYYSLAVNERLKQENIDWLLKACLMEFLEKKEDILLLQEIILLGHKIPSGCSGCVNLHGKMHGNNLLVCGIHPYGQEDCPDYA